MKIRSTLLISLKVGALVAATTGCASRPNKIMADTTILPYQAPDISEITGIEEPDEDSDAEGEGSAQTPAPTPAAASQTK